MRDEWAYNQTGGNTLQFYLGGKDLFEALVLEIHRAQHHIHVQMYIFSEDLTGRMIGDALIKAAERGVRIFMVLDAFGSKELSDETIANWKGSGISVRFFSPLFGNKGMRIRRRLHQKIICIDGKVGFTGGVNISDRYSGMNHQEPWLDHMIKAEGPVVKELETVCKFYWGRNRHRRIPSADVFISNGTSKARVIRNDRMRGKAEIAKAYKTALKNASESVIIFAAYFLPGARLRKELRKTAARNVKIILVLPGRSDVGIADRAMHFLYPWLFHCGIEIWEWDRSVLHAKVMVTDNKWMTLGSYNLNHLSDFSSIETNLEIIDPVFVKACADESMQLIRDKCIKIDPNEYKKHTGRWRRLTNRMAYILVRFLFRLLYFLTSRE